MTKRTTQTLSRGDVTVELVDLGEGYDGDYDPDNPADRLLWRFDVYFHGEPVDGASYCTQVPQTASKAETDAVLRTIMDAVYRNLVSGESIRRTCEALSWLDGSGSPIPGSGITVHRPVKRKLTSRKPKRNSRKPKRTSRR